MTMNTKETIDRIELELLNVLSKSGRSTYVIGLSGGIDSSVVATLAARSIGPKNVVAFSLPHRDTPTTSVEHARLVARSIDVDLRIFVVTGLIDEYVRTAGPIDRVRIGNLIARTRMMVLYDAARIHDGLVLGTGNRSEIALGYHTLHGDSAFDVDPIGQLYKFEIVEIAKWIGVPTEIIEKPPSAELWVGQTDEDEIGATYDDVDAVLMWMFDKKDRPNVDDDVIDRVVERVERFAFKREGPTIVDVGRIDI